jgi:hypothetical protein
MILSIIILALIVAGILVYDMPKPKPKQPKKRKYQVPSSFWDDYNHCVLSISNMKIDDTVRVENLIDNIMYQYVELMEYCVYIEKMSNLVDQYNKKVKTFLLSNNLN